MENGGGARKAKGNAKRGWVRAHRVLAPMRALPPLFLTFGAVIVFFIVFCLRGDRLQHGLEILPQGGISRTQGQHLVLEPNPDSPWALAICALLLIAFEEAQDRGAPIA